MNTTPALSIIVCTYNRASLLYECLQTLVRQTLDKEKYEIVVIDNCSTDHTAQVVTYFEDVHYYFEEKQGLSYARNRGFQEAKGDYIAYIDDDARANVYWAESVLHAFLSVKPKPIAVGGPAYPRYETTPPPWFTETFERRSWGSAPRFLPPNQAKYGFSGLNMAFQKVVLLEYQGFDTNLGVIGSRTRMGEETDLFYRIWCSESGKEKQLFWYEPDMFIQHWCGKRNWQIAYRIERNYRGGEAIAYIEYTRYHVPRLRIVKMAAYMITQPFSFLRNCIGGLSVQTAWIQCRQNISFAYGYLSQIIRMYINKEGIKYS